MITKITKWGNSQGLRISKELLSNLGVREGEEVEVLLDGKALTIRPNKNPKTKVDLTDLVAEMPADYHVDESDWGENKGKEIW